MSAYELTGDFYLLPTTGGAFHAISSPGDSPTRRLLLALLRHRSSPRVDTRSLCDWLGTSDDQAALAILHRAQSLAWVEGYTESRDMPGFGVGQELHQMLPYLSSTGKGLIVDWNGLSLASAGVDDETAATLSALSADLIAVQERHSSRLSENLGLATHGWAAVDAYGSSRIGAWPLYVGDERLMLVLLGEPQLNSSKFLAMIWVLINRYG